MTTMTRPSPNQAAAEAGRERRRQLLALLEQYHLTEGVAPTREELAATFELSKAAIRNHLAVLIDEGAVEDLGGTRGLRIPR